jgi:nucleotide-binding universal stress UspA family protein
MFTDVVVPLDGSEFAATALPIAVELASIAGAAARVVGVAESDAELSLTYDHVHDDAKRAGIDAAAVEVLVDPDPVKTLLDVAADERSVLCLASHDRVEPLATFMHSVGSQVIERAQRPLVLTGRNTSIGTLGAEVVVAVDGVENPEPLLAVATAWALRLGGWLRIVTVYEPVLADLRRPQHYTRMHGPPGDPEVYLAAMRERVSDVGLTQVATLAIEDAIGPGRGLEEYLGRFPARLLVLGGSRRHARLPSGVARHMLETATCPLLIVNPTS